LIDAVDMDCDTRVGVGSARFWSLKYEAIPIWVRSFEGGDRGCPCSASLESSEFSLGFWIVAGTAGDG